MEERPVSRSLLRATLAVSHGWEAVVGVALSAKNALVTGAARGLGEAVVRRLSEAGAAVWAVDVRRRRARPDQCAPAIYRTGPVDRPGSP
ncbi:MAG: SDR family NAD(P)-dependent oxidoreductase [Catenulispora sp.]